MERPSCSRSVQMNHPDFEDRVWCMLEEEVDDPDVMDEDDDDSVVDDSNADPDFVMENSDEDSTTTDESSK